MKDHVPSDFLLPIHPSKFNCERGVGTITCRKENLGTANVPYAQVINDGDILKVRNQFYEVLGWSRDSFIPSTKVVRFTTDFEKNANSAKYFVCSPPLFKGNMQWLNKSAVDEYRPVVMSFDKEDILGYGRHSISFQNACFNRLGFSKK